MTTVTIRPMPEKIRSCPKKWRPSRPPNFAFSDIGPGGLTREDMELALELFLLLDAESQEWYGGQGFIDSMERGINEKASL